MPSVARSAQTGQRLRDGRISIKPALHCAPRLGLLASAQAGFALVMDLGVLVGPASFAGCDDSRSHREAVQRTFSRALAAVVVPAALDAVTLQLTVRRLRALPTASLGLASVFAMPFICHA
jgi:hypothetical protein